MNRPPVDLLTPFEDAVMADFDADLVSDPTVRVTVTWRRLSSSSYDATTGLSARVQEEAIGIGAVAGNVGERRASGDPALEASDRAYLVRPADLTAAGITLPVALSDTVEEDGRVRRVVSAKEERGPGSSLMLFVAARDV